ncbi:MAG: hypothetical protein HYY16_04415 [Planctomycetes bacterium]|nr:hypothetical protein [Planctomycetota bacterium]
MTVLGPVFDFFGRRCRPRASDKAIEMLLRDFSWCVAPEGEAEEIVLQSKGAANQANEFRLRVAARLHPNYLILHGAAVATAEGAFGFIGQSMAGKTTAALFMAVKGARLLSDDSVAVSVKDRRAHPFPTPMSLRDSSVRLLTRHGAPAAWFSRPTFCLAQSPLLCREPLPLRGLFLIGEQDLNAWSFLFQNGRHALCSDWRECWKTQCDAFAGIPIRPFPPLRAHEDPHSQQWVRALERIAAGTLKEID